MLICGRQSIVEVNTSELVPAEDGPSVAVDFTIRVETYGFTACRRVFIEQRDARRFVSHLRAIEQVRQAAVTLAATPLEDFQLHIGFIGQTGRATVKGRLTATDAGDRTPTLEFDFEFDPATLPTIVAECERWIAPPRPTFYLCTIHELMDGMDEGRASQQFTLLASILDKLGYQLMSGPGMKIDQLWAIGKDPLADDRAGGAAQTSPERVERVSAFERQFLAWLHIRLGVLPKPRPGTTGEWTFEWDSGTVNFSILAPGTNGAADVDWRLRVEEHAPYTFTERVERHFEPGSGARHRTADGLIRTQFTSTAVFQPFTDQTDRT